MKKILLVLAIIAMVSATSAQDRIAVGLKKDNQAAKEGRQLKYSIAI